MARRRSGLPRARLVLAAIATACFGLTIVLAGTASAANGGSGSGSIQPLSRILALVAAFGYLAAFVPPRWLTRLVHRAVAFDLTRSIVTLEDETADPDALWVRLEAAAETILGAPTVVVRERRPRRRSRYPPTPRPDLGAAGSADRRRRDDGLGAARRRGRGGRPERACSTGARCSSTTISKSSACSAP